MRESLRILNSIDDSAVTVGRLSYAEELEILDPYGPNHEICVIQPLNSTLL